MDGKDTLLVWLLKKADFLIGPSTYQCGHCLASVEGGLADTWPHHCPGSEELRKDGPTEDTYYAIEGLEEIMCVPPEMASHLLDIWEWAGAWDRSIATGAGQLKLLCEEYGLYLVGDEREQKAREYRKVALDLIKQALLNQQLINGGQPITATVLMQQESELCDDALAILGEKKGAKAALIRLLGDLSPEVVKGAPSRGYPTWSLSSQLLVENNVIEDPAAKQARMDQAKALMEGRARELLALGQTSWQLRQFCLRYGEDVKAVLELTGVASGDHKALAALLAIWSDTFCVVGYQSGSALWALVGVEVRSKAHNQQFARFSGQKDKT